MNRDVPGRLVCDRCKASTATDSDKAGWFVFCDSDGPGNARCPNCLPARSIKEHGLTG